MDYYHKYMKYKTKYQHLKANLIGGSPLKISIQNPPETPWLDWIEQGIKKYEGRLNKGIFKTMKVGDTVIWFDRRSGKEVTTRITELKYYKDFRSAFRALGDELVPALNATEDTVERMYLKYFSPADIERFGVVAIGVTPV